MARTQIPSLDGGAMASAFSERAADIVNQMLLALREVESRLSLVESEKTRLEGKIVELERFVRDSLQRAQQ